MHSDGSQAANAKLEPSCVSSYNLINVVCKALTLHSISMQLIKLHLGDFCKVTRYPVLTFRVVLNDCSRKEFGLT